MAIIFVRTLILYFSLLLFLRLLGKRQLGEMELSEFLVASLIADLAANPLQDIGMPLLNGLIPIATLFCCELLIYHGTIDQREMVKNRFTLDELMQEMRSQGVRDLAAVEYAFLETNGKLSILLYTSKQPPSAEEMNIPTDNIGFPRILVSDGRLIQENLQKSGHDMIWLQEQLSEHGVELAGVFLMTVDDASQVYCVKKELLK